MSASLEKGLNAFREVMDAPIASFFSSCVHCGMCAEACLFYTETGDPKYTPIHKLEPLKRLWRREYTLLGRLAGALGMIDEPDDDELEEWSELVYDSCTLCGRCSMVCPVGNDIVYMVRKMREGMAISGHAPKGLVGAMQRTIEQGSPMGVQLHAFEAQVRHQQEATGIEIPVDREGADYLAIFSSMEIINYPEYIGSLAKIFQRAGVSWTISTHAFEATNAGIQIGSSDLARDVVKRIVDAAEALKVKYVISPECGHGYTALRWEGPNLIGRPFQFEVIHILELLEQLRREGRIKLQKEFATPATFHDPCQIVRRGGVIDEPRNLLREVVVDFRDMHDHGTLNWCCGGGGGVSANDRAEAISLKAFRRKKSQIEATGTNTLITTCANCRIVLEEGIDHYHMGTEVLGLTELVAEYLEE